MAHVLFWPILFSLVIEFSCNSGMQSSCVQMSKEENRKEHVDRKVQIHHYHHITIKKKKNTCAGGGVVWEGQHRLHSSRIFIQLTININPTDCERGYFGHAVIYKIETGVREASISVYADKLYFIYLGGRDRAMNCLGSKKIYPQTDRCISLCTHMQLRHGFGPENFHASRMSLYPWRCSEMLVESE